ITEVTIDEYKRELSIDYYDSYYRKIFDKLLEENSKFVTIKCSNDALFKEMYLDLFKECEIFSYIKGNDTISYTSNREQGIITIWLFK
ncbi:MAG: hypothetical protein IJZ36_04060, partial [Bacilli bacterium]|nr:hypothetical protein [Bacilli bacterium]